MNPDENRAEGYVYYVEVRDTRLLDHPELKRRLTVLDPEGIPHMRLDPSTGRCLALHGKIGRQALCSIYTLRPRGCRLLQPGDARCLLARKERGID